MSVGRAVILAARCAGAAQWPQLDVAAPQLAPVANTPILFHHLEALRDAGIRSILLVTDMASAAAIRNAVEHAFHAAGRGLDISYLVDEEDWRAVMSPAVVHFVRSEPFLLQGGDALVGEPLGGLVAHLELDGLVMRMPAPTPADAGRAETAGYVLGPALHAAILGAPGLREQETLDDALALLDPDRRSIEIRRVDGCLPCAGGAAGLVAANRYMLGAIRSKAPEGTILGSEVQGRADVDASAEIRDSLVRGPVAIGPGVRIRDAYVGPCTSIGAETHVESAEIEDSIVLDGALISHVDARIQGSLIGPGACLVRDAGLPRAARVSIGERAEIALS